MDWLIDGWMRASVIAVYCRKIIELEEELKIVSNNMKSLEIAEQEAWIHFALSNSRSQCRHCIHRITRCIKNVFFIQYTFQTRTSCHDLLGEPTLSCTEGCYIFAAILSFFFERLLDGYPEPTQTTPNPPTGGGGLTWVKVHHNSECEKSHTEAKGLHASKLLHEDEGAHTGKL